VANRKDVFVVTLKLYASAI